MLELCSWLLRDHDGQFSLHHLPHWDLPILYSGYELRELYKWPLQRRDIGIVVFNMHRMCCGGVFTLHGVIWLPPLSSRLICTDSSDLVHSVRGWHVPTINWCLQLQSMCRWDVPQHGGQLGGIMHELWCWQLLWHWCWRLHALCRRNIRIRHWSLVVYAMRVWDLQRSC